MTVLWVPSKGARRLWFLCLFFALGSFEWGYNVGILSSVLVHPGFKSLLGWHQTGSKPGQKGVITATYYLGTLLSYLFLSQPLSDQLGRRRACVAAVVISGVGVALQAGANGGAGFAFAMLVSGRLVTGVGSAVMSTGVPMYQSEVSPAKQRGRYVVMNHVGFIAGLASGFWVGYGLTFWTSPFGLANGWRVSLCVQYVPAVVFAVGLPFVPETPRWLLARDERARARASLSWLREGMAEPEEVEKELREIAKGAATSLAAAAASISGPGTAERNFFIWSSFWQETKQLLTSHPLQARLWRATLLHFMGQMCGATAMKYYLPTLFTALGFGTRIALMAGGIESVMKIPMNLVDAFLIDRFGRRWTLTAGCVMMATGMAVNAIVPMFWEGGENRVVAWTAVVFIFVYAMGYSVGFGPATWVYSSEIFPTHHRSRGLNLAAAGGSIGSLLTAQIWPVGVAHIHQYIYFYFAAVNILCMPVIWLFYPETARVSLEDMDALFGPAASDTSARARLHHSRSRRVQGNRIMKRSGTNRNDDGDAEDALLLAGRVDEVDGVLAGDEFEDAARDEGFVAEGSEVSDEDDDDYGWPAYRDEEDNGTQILRYVVPMPEIEGHGALRREGDSDRGGLA